MNPPSAAPEHVNTRRLIQVMEALSYGDAVSNITRDNARLLGDMGYDTRIYSVATDSRVSRDAVPVSKLDASSTLPMIFHYWGYTELEGFISGYRGPRAVYFHNITPAEYFEPQSQSFELTKRGYAQLRRIAGLFDLVLAPSIFDLVEYSRHLFQPRPTLCIPPLVDVQSVRSRPVDRAKQQELGPLGGDKFLFVGRVAPNKRHDLLMYAFDEYYREIRRDAHLFLVGSYGQEDSYYSALQRLRSDLASGDRVTFTGHVTDEELAAHYEAADLFVCASEHEGFGVPLVEAMAYGMPVIALNTSAVPEALGEAGLLVHKWDSVRVAELMNLAIHDNQLRSHIVKKQSESLQRFSNSAVEQALDIAARFLCEGYESPEFVWRGPGSGTETP